jgi:CubicO group peptidase (beta-lactamase class C family)
MKLLWCAAFAATLAAQTYSGAKATDDVIAQAIAQKRLPGAVLIVGHNGQIVYRKAYGDRALVPHTSRNFKAAKAISPSAISSLTFPG